MPYAGTKGLRAVAGRATAQDLTGAISWISLAKQSGAASNLAIWQIFQSGERTMKVNLTSLPIWSNLALVSIWPVWRKDQSGNLARGAIWHTQAKTC